MARLLKNKIYSISRSQNKNKMHAKQLEVTLHNLVSVKPEVRGTTLITYIVPGSMDL